MFSEIFRISEGEKAAAYSTFVQHPLASASPEEAPLSLVTLGQCLYRQHKYGEAFETYQQALSLMSSIHQTPHMHMSFAFHGMAQVLAAQFQYEEALRYEYRSLAIVEQILGVEHPQFAGLLQSIGMIFCQQSAYEKALPLLQQSLKIQQKLLGKQHPLIEILNVDIARTEKHLHEFMHNDLAFSPSIPCAAK